jgi:hypothetical protein
VLVAAAGAFHHMLLGFAKRYPIIRKVCYLVIRTAHRLDLVRLPSRFTLVVRIGRGVRCALQSPAFLLVGCELHFAVR